MYAICKKELGIKKIYWLVGWLFWMGGTPAFSQETLPGQFSGNLQSNAKFFMRDSLIGAEIGRAHV